MAGKTEQECFKEEDVIIVFHSFTPLKDQVRVDWALTTGFGNMEAYLGSRKNERMGGEQAVTILETPLKTLMGAESRAIGAIGRWRHAVREAYC